MNKGWTFLIWLYLFILSIELIKRTSLALSEYIHIFLNSSLSPIKAVSVGWFVTAVMQSSGFLGGLVIPFVANNLLPMVTAVFTLIGARVGAAGIAILISIPAGLKKKRRDFRHGFEIGLAYALYCFLVTIIVFLLEYFFNLFSNYSFILASLIGTNLRLSVIPNFIKLITDPVIKLLSLVPSPLFLFLIAVIILILTLKFFTISMVAFLGGEDKARKLINRYFKSKCKAFIIGLVFTMLVFSTAISITLLVPLAISRFINLKKAIPFILGATIGTSTDMILIALITGNISALAVAITYVLFGVLGAFIFLPYTDLLFDITKFTSKRMIHVSKRRAIIFLIIFILIPLLILLL